MRVALFVCALSLASAIVQSDVRAQEGSLGPEKKQSQDGGDFAAKKKAKMAKMREKTGTNGTASPQAESDAAASWSKALVFLPGNPRVQGSRMDSPEVREAFAALAGGPAIPVAVYMHGCTGIGPLNQKEDATFLAGLGLMVVMPDSFARERPISCSGGRNDYFPGVVKFRREEIIHAARQLNRLPFISRENRVLMGHSEGAVVVLQYPRPNFSIYIASGVQCESGKNQSPPQVPTDKALFVYRASGDSWAARGGSDDNCADAVASHAEGSKSLVLPGNDHWNGGHPDVRGAIKALTEKYFVR